MAPIGTGLPPDSRDTAWTPGISPGRMGRRGNANAIVPQCQRECTPPEPRIGIAVVLQKWRWTELNVTLGLIFVASLRKEWPMTCIAVRCPYCHSDQSVKHGKTARGTQRYLCQNTRCTKGSFLLDSCSRGGLPEVKHTIIDMRLNASGV